MPQTARFGISVEKTILPRGCYHCFVEKVMKGNHAINRLPKYGEAEAGLCIRYFEKAGRNVSGVQDLVRPIFL